MSQKNREGYLYFRMNMKSARINGFEVSICGVDELPDFEGRRVTHVVSLWDGHRVADNLPRALIEALFPDAVAFFGFFDDVTHEFCGDYPPGKDVVQEILNFTKGLAEGDHLLVHCAYGVSRSTAIAFATLCQHAGRGQEEKCLNAVVKIRPIASPNPLLIRYADQILGAAGAMHGTLKSRKGRGTDR